MHASITQVTLKASSDAQSLRIKGENEVKQSKA
jgi:hypothetical protein